MMDNIAAPPHNLEAEQAVIGAILRNNDAIDKVGDLQAKHFYRQDHRDIYAELVKLISQAQPADVITVWTALQARDGVNSDGLLPYLNQMAQNVPSAFLADRYAKIVVDSALLRAVIQVSDKVAGLAHSPNGMTADQVLDSMQSMISSLAERRTRNEPRYIREVLGEFIDGMTKRSEGLDAALATGLPELDEMLNGGLRPDQLIIVAGRPSMGKTAFTADIGLNIAEKHQVLMFSMEMSQQEMAARSLANRGQVHLSKVIGKIAEEDTDSWNRVSAGIGRLSETNFAIDETGAITLLELRLKAKAWKRKHGLDLIIVDYIGLMTGGDGDNRTAQIGSYSRGLKALAKELKIPVIALAQLNRMSEQTGDKKPMLSHLRDSGEIEQDADVVIFVHRPEMHFPNAPEFKGYAELLIRKQRSGSLGDISLKFDGPTCHFGSWHGPAPEKQKEPTQSKRFE